MAIFEDMKVCILTNEPFPEGMAAAQRIKCYARALRSAGAECEVVVCTRTEHRGSVRNTHNSGFFDGVAFRYIGDSTVISEHRWIRKWNGWNGNRRTVNHIRKNLSHGDVLFMYMGRYPDLMLRFMKAAKKVGAYCVRDLCELPYGTGAETPEYVTLRNRVLDEQFPLLDGVVSISDSLMRLAQEHCSPSCKHIKVPIMVDYGEYNLPDTSAGQEIPYIFHSGTLYEQKDGILGMLEAFGIAVEKIGFPVHFVLTGSPENSPHKDEIHSLIDRYRIHDKVVFKGYLSDSELKDCLAGASLTIINKYPTQQNRYCFSTKLGEYLSAGKPVIVTRVGEAMNWLKDGESAFIIEPEDTSALADAIVRAFNNPEERAILSANARETASHCFDFKVWGRPLMDFLNNLGK